MDMVLVEVAAAGVRLQARSWPGGTGRPVLLVHGLSSNARLWDEVAARLAAADHPVVAVDLRGHGASAAVPDPPDGPGATLTAAADLAAVCTDLGWSEVDGAVVAGQSWGGNVVLQLAADRPGLVHGLALVDGGWLHLSDRWASPEAAWEVLAPPAFDGLTATGLRARLVERYPDWSPGAIEATLANLRERPDGGVVPRLDRQRHRGVVASMFDHRPRELYARVRCPTLVLVALPGSSGSRELAVEAAAAIPGGELVEFPDSVHDLHAQHPNRVAELIRSLA